MSKDGGKKRWPTDASLVRACLAGDSAAWEALIHRYRRLIFSIPVAYRLPADDAEEIFQRVVVKLFEHLGRLKNAKALPAWIVVTTRRECQSWFRGQRRTETETELDGLATEPEDVDRRIDGVRSQHTLALALEKLDRTCKDLLSTLYLEDPTPSYAEISGRLGRPVGSLGPTRKRCLKKLRSLFLGLGGEDLGE